MGIFFNFSEKDKKRNIFNEIEATRPQPQDQEDNTTATTDYTEDDEDQRGDNTPDNPADAPEDYTVPDEGEEQAPEEADQNAPEEGTEATGGDAVDNEQYGDEGGDAGGGGNAGSGGDEGGEGTEDYTDDEGGGDEGGDDYGDEGTDPSDDEVRQLEDEIFSNYTAEQIAIMNKDLKNDFNKLFLMLDDLVDHINDIPKVMEHIRTIEFVSNKLSELRDMVSDYMYNTYNTKSYTENKIAYNRFLITVKQINAIISKIPSLKDSKHET